MDVQQSKIQRIQLERIKRFQQKIFQFYTENKRTLPWRNTTDPYKILLSELMLQQTQVNRVIDYYTRWIALWPTIDALACARRTEVLKEWMGLGYNTRAVRLHQAAKIIVAEFDSDVIAAMTQYKEIPGIGRYTSHAVQIFSTNADLVTVDTNIRRILIKEFDLPENVPDATLWAIAQRCLPKGRSRDWHNALMDYGSLIQTTRTTGIKPKTTQSRFDGSDRQLRASIIRMLLQHDESPEYLSKVLHIEHARLMKILEKLIHENIVTQNNNRFSLKE